MPSSKKKRTVSEGDVVAVPLRGGGWAVGVVARVSARAGICFGYFFGPKLLSKPEENEWQLDHQDAIWADMFGILGIELGEWLVVGRVSGWDRENWPLPAFQRRVENKPEQAIIVTYSDDDPSKIISEVPGLWSASRPPDGLSGYGAVEIRLTMLLLSSDQE